MSFNFTTFKQFIGRFRGSRLLKHESVWGTQRVSLIARERGKIVARRESDNVVVNAGRTWLRGLVSAQSYPELIPPTVAATDMNVNAFDPATDVQTQSKYRPRYIAFGVGGTMQTTTPPGAGTFTEVVTVTGLEAPVEYLRGATTWYMAQVQDQDLTNTDYAPDAYSIRFRRIAGLTDISYAAQPTYGVNVPLSEVGLFLSSAVPTVTTSGSPAGFCAYNTFSTITKTPLITVEVIWEWRF